MKHMFAILGVAGLLIPLTACTSDPTTLPPGKYKESYKSSNSAGTDTQTKTTTNVYYDQFGNKRAVQETETTNDPKGLMNKSTSTTVKSY